MVILGTPTFRSRVNLKFSLQVHLSRELCFYAGMHSQYIPLAARFMLPQKRWTAHLQKSAFSDQLFRAARNHCSHFQTYSACLCLFFALDLNPTFWTFAFDALAYTGKALAQALSVCLCTAHQDLLPLCCPDCFQAVCGCLCVCVCVCVYRASGLAAS